MGRKNLCAWNFQKAGSVYHEKEEVYISLWEEEGAFIFAVVMAESLRKELVEKCTIPYNK